MESVYHLKENNLQYLLPMIKFEFSSEKFRRLVSVMPWVLESFHIGKVF